MIYLRYRLEDYEIKVYKIEEKIYIESFIHMKIEKIY